MHRHTAHFKKGGGGVEVTALASRGGECGDLLVVQSLWTPPGDGDLLLIPGEGDMSGRELLAGIGTEFGKASGGV